MKPKPPCWTDGVDCQNRRVGCQISCEKYKAFRAEIDRINAQRLKELTGFEYANEAIWRKRQINKHTESGRRALSQK